MVNHNNNAFLYVLALYVNFDAVVPLLAVYKMIYLGWVGLQ